MSRYVNSVKEDIFVGAASNKVAGILAALRCQRHTAHLVSSPIVTSSRNRKLFGGRVLREAGAGGIYLPSISIPGLNRLFSSVFYLAFSLKIGRRDTVILYNFFPEYMLAALYLRFRYGRRKIVIDVEDAPRDDECGVRGLMNRVSFKFLRRICGRPALVASQSLGDFLNLHEVCVINGIAPRNRAVRGLATMRASARIGFLYGGSIEPNTGLDLFVSSMRQLAMCHGNIAQDVSFTVTGRGGGDRLAALADEMKRAGFEFRVLQNADAAQYRTLLSESDVGLSLKLPGSGVDKTTFPSKVIEYAAHGLLVITTKVSDIEDVFHSNSATLLEGADELHLTSAILEIANNWPKFSNIALIGEKLVRQRYDPDTIGLDVIAFLKFHGCLT
jgi:glycosyltransferase involved in cell wall biosynthesis